MKFSKTIIKNLKLLIRTKTSAVIVILGPLLIILLVALALNKPTSFELTVGYYSPDGNNSLIESFMDELRDKNYNILTHETEEDCISKIKEGASHTCIVFQSGFEIGNQDKNNIKFYVDYSRTNFVYQIIGFVSEKFNIKTEELSKDLTQVLLTKITSTKKDVDDYILSSITLKSSIDIISGNVGEAKDKSSDIDFQGGDINLEDINSQGKLLKTNADSLWSKGNSAIVEGLDFADEVGNATTFKDELNELKEDINRIDNSTDINYEEFTNLVSNATEKVDNLKAKLSEQKTKNVEVISKLNEIKSSLSSIRNNLDELKGKLEKTNANLESIDIVDAGDIVSPIKTEIKPIVSETNQLIFMFPYILTLIIMFIGIMISSNLIMMEKHSKAFFRNFITPTKENFFILTTFITSFIIMFVQVLIILILSYFFIENTILDNCWVSALIIIFTITVFILIGMIIGYIAKTQESNTMLSISICSILLLLSNFILPIESMSHTIKQLIRYNPFIISSELLKKSFLFEFSFLESLNELLALGLFLAILIALVFIINKLSRTKLFSKTFMSGKTNRVYLPEDCYLKVGGYCIKNKKHLVSLLEHISDKEFNEHIEKNNIFADWTSKILKERKLGWKLRFSNQQQMIDHLKKKIDKEKNPKKKKFLGFI